MIIMTEARAKDTVEKAVVLEKDSETQYAECVDEPALGMGIAAFRMTEPLKDADYGTFDQPMEKKPTLFETDSGNLEIDRNRKQGFIKLVGKQCVSIEVSTQITKGKSLQLMPESTGEEEDKDSTKGKSLLLMPESTGEEEDKDSTQIPKGKSLQLMPESTGEEEDKDTRTQHLGGAANKPGPDKALRQKIDPACAAEFFARRKRYKRQPLPNPEDWRRWEASICRPMFLPARDGEKEGQIGFFRRNQEGRIEIGRQDEEGDIKWSSNDELCDYMSTVPILPTFYIN